MVVRVFDNGGADGGLWSNGANFVGGIAPTSSDIVQLDSTSTADCIPDVSVDGVDQQVTYSGAVVPNTSVDLGDYTIAAGSFNGGNFALAIKDFTQSGGVFTSTSAVLSIRGDWDKTGGTFLNNSGQFDWIFLGASQEITNTAVEVFYKFRIAKSVWDINVNTTKIQVSNRFIVDNGLTSSAELRGTIELIDNCVVEQNGSLFSGDLGILKFSGSNHEWIQNVTNDSFAQMPSIVVDSTDLTLTEGVAGNVFGMPSLTWLSGTITNAETSHIRNNRQFQFVFFHLFQTWTIGELTLNPSNFDVSIQDETGAGPATLQVNGDVNILSVTSGCQFFGVGSTLAIKGNYIQGNTGTPSANSTLRVLFNGTGAQHISMPDGADEIPTNLLEVDKTTGTLTILDVSLDQDQSGTDFLLTNGTVDLNGFDLTVADAATVNGNFADLAGSTITIGGNFASDGSALEGSAEWFLNVTGTNEATRGTIKNCNASGGTQLTARGAEDLLGNTNVIFLALLVVWSGSGVASSGANWVGGTAPRFNDIAKFDGTSLAECLWDLAEVFAIEGDTGLITMVSGTALVGTLDVGSANPNEGMIISQDSGSSLQITNDLTVHQDDTIAENKLVRVAGTLDTVIGGSLIVEPDAALDFTGDTSTITIGGDGIIDFDSICNFGNTRTIFTGTGIIDNDNLNNQFRDLECAFPGKKSTFASGNRCRTLSFHGGTVTMSVNSEMGMGLALDDQQILFNDPSTVFDNSGGFYLNIKPRGNALGVNTIAGINLAGGNIVAQHTNGVIKLLGVTTCARLHAGQGTIDLTGATVTSSDDVQIGSSEALIIGDGTLTANEFTVTGAVLFGSGNCNVSGDFSMGGFTDYGTSTVTFEGSASQNVTMGGDPHNIVVQKSGSTLDFLDAWTCSGVFRESAVADVVVEWLAAATFACDHVETIGDSGLTVSNVSSIPATSYQITVSDLGPVNRSSGWADCNIVGAFIRVDLLTGSNDGGNDVTSPDGIDFANFPVVTPDLIGIGRSKRIGGGPIVPNIYKGHRSISESDTLTAWVDGDAWVDAEAWED